MTMAIHSPKDFSGINEVVLIQGTKTQPFFCTFCESFSLAKHRTAFTEAGFRAKNEAGPGGVNTWL